MKHTILAGTLFLILALFACEQPKPRSPIIVKVGEEELTLEDLKNTVPVELQGKITREELQEFISRWINAHILYEEGRKLGLLQKPEIQQKIHEFEVGVVGNAYLETLLDATPLVTDSAVAAYYEKNKEDFVRNSLEYHLQHILVSEKKTADSIRTVLRRGVPFDSVAIKFAANLPEGMSWDLGYVSEDDLIPEISKRLKAYRVGSFTRPIKTEFGYHIFKIVDKKDRGTVKPLEDVREAIVARIEQDLREERYRQILNDLKSRAHIETNFQLLNRISLDTLFTQTKKLGQ